MIDDDRRLHESDYKPFPKGLCEVGISEKRVYQRGGNAKIHKAPWLLAASSNSLPLPRVPLPLMVSDRHPRNVRLPAESQIDIAGDDVARGTHVVRGHENATGGDYLREGLSQLSSPIPQRGYSLVNTSVSDPNSSSYRITLADSVQPSASQLDSSLYHRSPTCGNSQGSTFHESLGTFYDHHASSPGPRDDLHEGWEEPSYTSITALPGTPVIPPHVTLPMRQSEDPVRHNALFSVLHLNEVYRTHTICQEEYQIPHNYAWMKPSFFFHLKTTCLPLA